MSVTDFRFECIGIGPTLSPGELAGMIEDELNGLLTDERPGLLFDMEMRPRITTQIAQSTGVLGTTYSALITCHRRVEEGPAIEDTKARMEQSDRG